MPFLTVDARTFKFRCDNFCLVCCSLRNKRFRGVLGAKKDEGRDFWCFARAESGARAKNAYHHQPSYNLTICTHSYPHNCTYRITLPLCFQLLSSSHVRLYGAYLSVWQVEVPSIY